MENQMTTDARQRLVEALKENEQKEATFHELARVTHELAERKAARERGAPNEWPLFLNRVGGAATRANNDISEQSYLYNLSNDTVPRGAQAAAVVRLLKNQNPTGVALKLWLTSEAELAVEFSGVTIDKLTERDIFDTREEDVYLLLVNLFVHFVRQRQS